MAGRSIRIRAYAKLNLGLEVRGRRADGAHELHTHLQSVDLADELCFTPTSDGRIVVSVTPGLGIPMRENLVYRAAALFFSRTGISKGLRCELVKEIPPGSGLGGGSSDAAATLAALNALFGAGLSTEELTTWAAELGADVPFFLRGGWMCATGRGERLEPLPPSTFEGWSFVVAVPPVCASTAAVYARWDALNPTRKVQPAAGRCPNPSLSFSTRTRNDLEEAACSLYPELRRYGRLIRKPQAPLRGMTGSGSAWYAGFAREEQAHDAFQKLAASLSLSLGPEAKLYMVRPTPAGYAIVSGA